MATERCVGCDQAALVSDGGHPIVVVMHKDDAAARGFDTSKASSRGFLPVPACRACWVDPAHRVFPIKGHFFEDRVQAALGVLRAGTNRVG